MRRPQRDRGDLPRPALERSPLGVRGHARGLPFERGQRGRCHSRCVGDHLLGERAVVSLQLSDDERVVALGPTRLVQRAEHLLGRRGARETHGSLVGLRRALLLEMLGDCGELVGGKRR